MKSSVVLIGTGALAVVLFVGLTRSPKPSGADATGRMPEAVATGRDMTQFRLGIGIVSQSWAAGTNMLMDEVVVRAVAGGVADARLGSGSAN